MIPNLSGELIGLLDAVILKGLDVETARIRLARIAAAHPGLTARLVCEREQYAGAVHPEIVVELPDDTLLVIARSRERALPFLARAAFRPAEDELVRVDGETITIVDAIEHLEIAYDATSCAQIVNGVLLGQAARVLGVADLPVADTELQTAMDEFRLSHDLYESADLASWLGDRGMTQELLEMELERGLRMRTLATRLVGPRVESYFEANREDFERASLALVVVRDLDTASTVARRLSAGEDLLRVLDACAQEHVVRASVAEVVRKRDLPDTVRAAAFAAPDRWTEPVVLDESFAIARVSQCRPAILDDATKAEIRELLLAAWLADRRAKVAIEWFWGRVPQ